MNRALLLALALAAGAADAGPSGYGITSLNTPDPIFVTSGNSMPVSISAPDSALRRATLLLNGNDVTSALSPSGPGTKSGTVTGLLPGINTFELLKNASEKKPMATLKVAKAKAPVLACSTASFPASALPVPSTVVTSALPVAAATTPQGLFVPAHCLINGAINAGRVGTPTSPGAPQSRYTYQITWQARLPDAWNSKLHMPGGGGTDGSVPATNARVGQGYAVAANDSGHNNFVNTDPQAGGSASFGTDYLARVDFAYNAIDVTTQTAKALVDLYYGEAPKYSYFEGCSMGGREAMMVTQRLPSYFDGSVSGDPAFRITKVGVWAAYEGQQLAALARTRDLISVFGVPYANNTFTNGDLQLLSNAILKACDQRDGLVDGMVSNPNACTTPVVKPFLDALKCSGDKTASCLAADQIEAIVKIYSSGAPNSQGVPQYAPWMWDAGIAGCTSTADCNVPGATNINTGWRLWNVGNPFNTNFVPHVSPSTNGAFNFASLGGGAIPLLFATPPILPAPTANDGLANLIMNYDFDTLAASIHGTSAQFPISDTDLLNVDSTDLRPYRDYGGKLIIWQPQTGGPFSPQDMVNWYTDMNHGMQGGANFKKTKDFARLFLMPGANHCGGGPATSTIDAFSPLVNWVENGVAPARIVGTAPAATPFPGRTRPLCPYPQYAHYTGSGDINSAANFVCRADGDDDEEE
jgi:feruloyl esterase